MKHSHYLTILKWWTLMTFEERNHWLDIFVDKTGWTSHKPFGVKDLSDCYWCYRKHIDQVHRAVIDSI